MKSFELESEKAGVWGILVLVLFGVGNARAEEPEPPPPPPVVCIEDASLPRREVESAFSELQRIHRARVPGPSGQRLLDARIDEMLERFVGFDMFVDLVLGDAWDQAEGEQRTSWRATLHDTLRRRYLRKLGSPLRAELEVRSVRLKCDRAEVTLVIRDRDDKRQQDVVLELVATPLAEERVAWRAYDVAVDGVSLLETWRSRFRRIYDDGGVAAIDHHMRGLRERYRSDPE